MLPITCSYPSFYNGQPQEHFCADSRMTVKPSSAEQISHLLCALQGTVRRHGLLKRQLCHPLRGRDGPCCVPGPGLFLLHSSFHPLSLPLGLCSLENSASTLASLLSGISSSAWKEALFSHCTTLSPLYISSLCFLASHLSSRKWSLHSAHFVTSHVLLSYSDLIFAPTILLISLSLSPPPTPL